MNQIIEIPYEQSRREFFLSLRDSYRRKLRWWKQQYPHQQYDPSEIHDKCVEYGAAVSYLQDVLRLLEAESTRTGISQLPTERTEES